MPRRPGQASGRGPRGPSITTGARRHSPAPPSRHRKPTASANDRPETAQFIKPRETPVPISLPPLFHVGIIVEDFDRAVADYEKRWGANTEQITDLEFPTAKLHGEVVGSSARYGFIRTGSSEIELIQPLAVHGVPRPPRRRRPPPRLRGGKHRPAPRIAASDGRRGSGHLRGIDRRPDTLRVPGRSGPWAGHRADRNDRRRRLTATRFRTDATRQRALTSDGRAGQCSRTVAVFDARARVPTVRAPERQPTTGGQPISPPCSEAPSRPHQGGLHDERHDAASGPTSEFGPSPHPEPRRQRVGARPARRMSR